MFADKHFETKIRIFYKIDNLDLFFFPLYDFLKKLDSLRRKT